MNTPHDIPSTQTEAPASVIPDTDDTAELVVLNMAVSDNPGAPGLADDDVAVAFI